MAETPMLSDLTDEDVEALLEHYRVPEQQRVTIRQEVTLSRALRAECFAIGERIKAGEAIRGEDLSRRLAAVAEQLGYDMGIPFPDLETGHQFVTARNTPLGYTFQYMTGRTEHATELEQAGVKVRNSWEHVGDRSIAIVESKDGEIGWLPDYHAGRRLRKNVGGAMTRALLPNLTAEAELKAMDALKNKIGHPQWTSYVLTGMFAERSAKSDLHYLFRKGLPTLVLSYHGGPEWSQFSKEHDSGGRIIAALCLHPFGYYAGTHIGAMTPTDEVIAHLLLMRADEHKFWGKSGQWSAIDPRSGI